MHEILGIFIAACYKISMLLNVCFFPRCASISWRARFRFHEVEYGLCRSRMRRRIWLSLRTRITAYQAKGQNGLARCVQIHWARHLENVFSSQIQLIFPDSVFIDYRWILWGTKNTYWCHILIATTCLKREIKDKLFILYFYCNENKFRNGWILFGNNFL